MFRVQDNVPEVYINESRDFQVFARAYDNLLSGIKFDIDTIPNLMEASTANDRVLRLMCGKVGFFPTIEIDSNVLRYIIAGFPYIIKNKGNKKGIEGAVNCILKAENKPQAIGKTNIFITNRNEETKKDEYSVQISTSVELYNERALREILKYVIPTGYIVRITSYRNLVDAYVDEYLITNTTSIYKELINETSVIASKAESDTATTDMLYRNDTTVVCNKDESEVTPPTGK